jgi:dephospho-CoA kinase
MSPYRVGLTGGLAAGKSTVAGWLGEAGFRVVDADRLVAELYRPGGEGAVAVTELFGAEFLTADGSVDHLRLAREVFAEPAARRRLEDAIHPLVKQRFDELTRGGDGVAVLEATLLVEAGFVPDFDLVVTVEANPELRLQRAVARGLEPAAARQRLEAQSEAALRIAAAHRVLWNNGSLDELRSEVEELVAELRGHNGDD